MNALQETILDRLMAADRIGALWTPGPVRLACEALQGAGLADGAAPDQALGYPLVFCRALEGASGVLATVDEVRTLAISVFTEVPPRPQPPTLSPRRLVEVAVWGARQASLYHEEKMPAAQDCEEVLEEFLTCRKPFVWNVEALCSGLGQAIGRVRLREREVFSPGRLTLSAYYFALHALRQVLIDKDPEENAARACRDVARLATLTRGLKGAVPYCLALAQTLDM